MVPGRRRRVEYLAVGPAEPSPRRNETERAQRNLCLFLFLWLRVLVAHNSRRSIEKWRITFRRLRFPRL